MTGVASAAAGGCFRGDGEVCCSSLVLFSDSKVWLIRVGLHRPKATLAIECHFLQSSAPLRAVHAGGGRITAPHLPLPEEEGSTHHLQAHASPKVLQFERYADSHLSRISGST